MRYQYYIDINLGYTKPRTQQVVHIMKQTHYIISAILLFFTSTGFSQALISESDLTLKSNLSERRESIAIVSSDQQEVSLFVVDRKNIYLSKYTSLFELLDQQKFERPKTRAKNIIKIAGFGKQYVVLTGNDSKKKIELITLNAVDKKATLLTQTILAEKERYLISFTHSNQIYVVGVIHKKSLLNIHKIDLNGNVETTNYDLSNEKFFNGSDKEVSLYKSLLTSPGGTSSPILEIEQIEEDVPTSLEVSSKMVKLYLNDDTITLSLDNSYSYTQLVTLGLTQKNYSIKNVKKPTLLNIDDASKIWVKSNSFLSRNKLYQIIGKNRQMKFLITDLETDQSIKQIHLQKGDSITFKNSPIIQEGGMYNSHREMEKTQKFLRKIASSKIAVSVRHTQGTIEITMGGVKKTAGNAGFGAFGAMGGAMGGAIAGASMGFAQPTFGAYVSYTNTVSTRIHCLFNENLEHVAGEVPKTAFDKIKEFTKDVLYEKAETVFKFNGYYVYGYYKPLKHKYYLRKFKD